MFTEKRVGIAGVLLLALAWASPGYADEPMTLEDIRAHSPELARAIEYQAFAPKSNPSVAFGSPIGFGTGYGEFFAGVNGQTLPEHAQDPADGSMELGVGIGDPVRWVALEATTSIISVTEEFGHDGNFNFKLHHALPHRIGVAIGVMNTGRWGDAKVTKSSTYAAITRPFQLSSITSAVPTMLVLNAGVGQGRFGQFDDDLGRYDGVGVFGGVALMFARRISVIADWTGNDLNAGVSLTPFRTIPLVITLGMVNLTEDTQESELAGNLTYTLRL